MKNPVVPILRIKQIGHIGGKGSYSHEAAKQYFPEDFFTSFDHFENVFKALENKTIDYGVVPIENSSTGGIRDVYDLLIKCKLHIVGEVYVNIEHHLLGLPGASRKDIQMVCSHPQGLMQSSEFIRINDYETKLCKDTDSAAAFIKENGNPSFAAIASASAGRIHNLNVIEKSISNFSHNTTRFFVLSSKPMTPCENGLTSLVFTTRHEPGCLYSALKHLSDYGINMLRIESRPMENRPWEYYFFVDIEGSTKDSKVQSALAHLEKHTLFFRILGSYINGKIEIESCG
ncbi:MAG: prephenate dehydratase [Peptostreptococcaceae bacterium]|nr:prephenate dehydratase [Peptostreptococcaceae bacterium]